MQLRKYIKGILIRVLHDIEQYRWIIIAFLLWNIIMRSIFHAFCPVLIFAGVPCAGCGTTRAIWFILTGQLERGMILNPIAPLWMCFICYVVWRRYLLGTKVNGIYILLILITSISIIVYIYRMKTVFPSYPPMVYHYNCILEKIFPGYILKLKSWIG